MALSAHHLLGLQNTLADALSRGQKFGPGDWTLPREVVRAVFLRWGMAQVVLFASKHNSQLPVL